MGGGGGCLGGVGGGDGVAAGVDESVFPDTERGEAKADGEGEEEAGVEEEEDEGPQVARSGGLRGGRDVDCGHGACGGGVLVGGGRRRRSGWSAAF